MREFPPPTAGQLDGSTCQGVPRKAAWGVFQRNCGSKHPRSPLMCPQQSTSMSGSSCKVISPGDSEGTPLSPSSCPRVCTSLSTSPVCTCVRAHVRPCPPWLSQRTCLGVVWLPSLLGAQPHYSTSVSSALGTPDLGSVLESESQTGLRMLMLPALRPRSPSLPPSAAEWREWHSRTSKMPITRPMRHHHLMESSAATLPSSAPCLSSHPHA
ncbi:uncharacterized protein LOC133753718 [Lepus europaeus]|uniref:uncharacterized protein LOC133753718 n=1 Tax=Lepus europaeus TaxID=9983 RepID=UPI002B460227|nr:uncharacterized protein LOC133753718 [Lepus europaeus]